MKRTLTQKVFFNTVAGIAFFALSLYGCTRETTEGILLAFISCLLCAGLFGKIRDWHFEERNNKKNQRRMTAEEYWKSKYPEVAMPKTNHEKYVNDLEKAAIWEFAEAYHREKMAFTTSDMVQLLDASEATQTEQKRILGIIEELAWDETGGGYYLLEKIELIEKIKG